MRNTPVDFNQRRVKDHVSIEPNTSDKPTILNINKKSSTKLHITKGFCQKRPEAVLLVLMAFVSLCIAVIPVVCNVMKSVAK